MKKLFAILVLLSSSAIAQPAAPEPNADIHNALRALKSRLVDAINRSDIDAMVAELHPNVVITWQDATVSKGRDGVKAYLTSKLRGENPVVKHYHADVEVDALTTLYGGDTGIAYGSSVEQFDLRGGAKFTLNGRWSATMVNENGRWYLASVHASSNLFDNPLVKATKKLLFIILAIAVVVAFVIGWLIGRRKAGA